MGSLETSLIATVNGLGSTPIGGRNSTKSDEASALKAFDAYFLGEMLRQSRPKNTDALFDGGQAGRMYQDHLYQEFARVISEKGDFGLAGSLKGSLGNDDAESPSPSPSPTPAASPESKKEVSALGSKEGS